jgi:RNA polymerase sigma-70 factor (ECF subfamily)
LSQKLVLNGSSQTTCPPHALNVDGGDPLERAYRLNFKWLVGRLRRQFGDHAEDLAQEAYARIARRHRQGGIRHPRALLLTVARNLGRDEARKALRSRSAGENIEVTVLMVEDATQHDATLLKEVIFSLPEPLRDVFVLSRVIGLTYEEIAIRLNLSVKSVEWRLSKALQHCVKHLRH